LSPEGKCHWAKLAAFIEVKQAYFYPIVIFIYAAIELKEEPNICCAPLMAG